MQLNCRVAFVGSAIGVASWWDELRVCGMCVSVATVSYARWRDCIDALQLTPCNWRLGRSPWDNCLGSLGGAWLPGVTLTFMLTSNQLRATAVSVHVRVCSDASWVLWNACCGSVVSLASSTWASWALEQAMESTHRVNVDKLINTPIACVLATCWQKSELSIRYRSSPPLSPSFGDFFSRFNWVNLNWVDLKLKMSVPYLQTWCSWTAWSWRSDVAEDMASMEKMKEQKESDNSEFGPWRVWTSETRWQWKVAS